MAHNVTMCLTAHWKGWLYGQLTVALQPQVLWATRPDARSDASLTAWPLLCRWQQLLAEWSAAEIDTWDDQRLTEQSAYWAGRESCHSGPGQQASRAGSSSQQQQQHSLPEQQQQHGLATANGHQQQQQPGGNMQDEGWQPEPEQQLQQQQWRQQVEEQEQEHEVSFVFRGEPSSSPERMPAAVAPGPATHSIPASTAGGAHKIREQLTVGVLGRLGLALTSIDSTITG